MVAHRGCAGGGVDRAPWARFAESTISARLGAVLSCYDFHVLNGVYVGRDLYRMTHRGGGRYKPLLEHVARRKGRREAVIRVRRPGRDVVADAWRSWRREVDHAA